MSPAFGEALEMAGHAYVEESPPTHELAVLNSQFERVEMMRPGAPLALITTQVSKAILCFRLFCFHSPLCVSIPTSPTRLLRPRLCSPQATLSRTCFSC